MSGDLDLQNMATAAIESRHLRLNDDDSLTTLAAHALLVEFGQQVLAAVEVETRRQVDHERQKARVSERAGAGNSYMIYLERAEVLKELVDWLAQRQEGT